MKKFLSIYYMVVLILLSSAVLICTSGCSMIDYGRDWNIASKLGTVDLYYSADFDGLETPKEIADFLKDHITYEMQDDYSRSPREVYESGKGDCKDFTRLFLNIYFLNTGIKAQFGVGSIDERTVANGGKTNHAFVVIDRRAFEPQTGRYTDYEIGYIYSFDEIFN